MPPREPVAAFGQGSDTKRSGVATCVCGHSTDWHADQGAGNCDHDGDCRCQEFRPNRLDDPAFRERVLTEAFKDASDEAEGAAALLQRARVLLAAGEGVAQPDWFDQADELVSDIDRVVPSDGCRTCHRPWTECEC